eukprot:m.20379 g.20379  ORF g.20379 m.20379 type:complete len:129 (+) comp6151_c0_seq2:17-403(+)
MEILEQRFKHLVERVPGLLAVSLTDRDGVPVAKFVTESCDEKLLNPMFVASATVAIEQAAKLGLGKNKSLVVSLGTHQVVHLNLSPLIANFVANETCNTGLLLSLADSIALDTETVRRAVDAHSAAPS